MLASVSSQDELSAKFNEEILELRERYSMVFGVKLVSNDTPQELAVKIEKGERALVEGSKILYKEMYAFSGKTTEEIEKSPFLGQPTMEGYLTLRGMVLYNRRLLASEQWRYYKAFGEPAPEKICWDKLRDLTNRLLSKKEAMEEIRHYYNNINDVQKRYR